MTMNEKEENIYKVLESLGISYVRHEHPPVYTVDQAEQHWGNIKGVHCKNIFLRNKKQVNTKSHTMLQ